jgi:BirA family transcriptional regulator, biotin operon repressor / biotin---[acetyl-CoA-carboxylase] ligase
VGIGVNLRQRAFPADLRTPATSLLLATGRVCDRTTLLAALLDSVRHHTNLLETAGPRAILDLFTHASSYVSGRRVVVEQPGQELRGVTCGLDEAGFLQVRDDVGRRHTVLAGGVRPA